MTMIKKEAGLFVAFILLFSTLQCTSFESNVFEIERASRIVLIGNNLGSRMMHFGHFETEM
ncbi:MAG: hypothetical protein WD035_01935, partial [Balneolaceae bacterium]